jgi:hypothetical protein
MIEFARNTPPDVAKLLRARLVAMPDHAILRALATHVSMGDLWTELGKLGNWRPGASDLIWLAVHFSAPPILSRLQKPPEERLGFSYPQSLLGLAADELAARLECWPNAAAELLGEPVDALVERLRAFATDAFEQAGDKQSFYDYIPEPSRRGRGNQKQLAFRIAFGRTLQRASEDASLPGRPLSLEQQDFIVATVTSVIFPKHPIDAGTIRRHRERQRLARRVGDKSHFE